MGLDFAIQRTGSNNTALERRPLDVVSFLLGCGSTVNVGGGTVEVSSGGIWVVLIVDHIVRNISDWLECEEVPKNGAIVLA